MFRKVLIANRGEIAVRIIRTLKRMGIASVAVYSDADRFTMPVSLADEAVRLGPAPATESYLNVDAVIAACDGATGLVRNRTASLQPNAATEEVRSRNVARVDDNAIGATDPNAIGAAGDRAAGVHDGARAAGNISAISATGDHPAGLVGNRTAAIQLDPECARSHNLASVDDGGIRQGGRPVSRRVTRC